MCCPLVTGGVFRCGCLGRFPGGLRASRGAVVAAEGAAGGSSGRSIATAESLGGGAVSVAIAGAVGSAVAAVAAVAETGALAAVSAEGAVLFGPRATATPMTARPASMPNPARPSARRVFFFCRSLGPCAVMSAFCVG